MFGSRFGVLATRHGSGLSLESLDEALDGCGEAMDVEIATKRLSVLSDAEESYQKQVVHDYLTRVQQHGMEEEWRSKIATWFHQLRDTFKLSSTTVFSAMSFLDRYLSMKSCTGVNYQLVAVASLFLASKIEEPKPITTADFASFPASEPRSPRDCGSRTTRPSLSRSTSERSPGGA